MRCEPKMSRAKWIVSLAILLVPLMVRPVAAQPDVESYLIDGKLRAGEKALQAFLKEKPDHEEARFGLGVVQFFKAIENLGRSLHRHGTNNVNGIPFLRLPVPANRNPEVLDYETAKAVFKTMIRDLEQVDETLKQVDSGDVKLRLKLFQVKLDTDGDGKFGQVESLASIARPLLGRMNPNDLKDVVVQFDQADVHWLRGYCHLLRAMCEFALAYDQEGMWDVVARRVFPNAKVKYDFLMEEGPGGVGLNNPNSIIDVIAGIHQLRFPLKDAAGMERARQHLLGMIAQSHKMWNASMKETDNEGEWIPNPDQTSAVSPTRVTQSMLEAWREFLDEAEDLLEGRKLAPFWRGDNPKRGINLKKVFTQPREFDLVLWIHGSAAVPYLEEGDVTRPQTWEQFQRAFRGDFVGFAIWFN